MADVNQSVEITYAADISGLLKQLEKIPGMSKKEAAAMAKNITKGLKDTEKAAKKAADTNAKAMKKMQRSANAAAKSMKTLKRSASQVGRGLKEMAMLAAGNNDEFAEWAEQAAIVTIAGGALIGMFTGLKAVIPVVTGYIGGMTFSLVAVKAAAAGAIATLAPFAGAIALIGAPILLVVTNMYYLQKAFDDFSKNIPTQMERIISAASFEVLSQKVTDATAKIKNMQMVLLRGSDSAQAALHGFGDIAEESAKRYDDIRTEMMLKQGKITQSRYEEIQLEKEILNVQKEMTDNFEAQKNSAKTQLNTYKQQAETAKELIKQELEKLKTTKESANRTLNENRLKREIAILNNKINSVDKEIAEHEKNIVHYAERMRVEKKAITRIMREQAELDERLAQEAEKKRKAEEWWAKEQERQKSLQQQALSLTQFENTLIFSQLEGKEKINASYEKQVKQLEEIKEKHDSLLKTGEQEMDITKGLMLLNDAQQKEIDEFDKKEQERLDRMAERKEKEAQMALKREEKLAEARIEAAERLRQEEERITEVRRQGVMSFFSDISTFANASMEVLKNSGDEQSALLDKLFRVNQAASVGKLAMEVTSAIGIALATLGPFGPLAAAGIAAKGAAQAAVIMSQPPPSSAMHMGGVTKDPDERVIRVLSGEAVLDRKTVNSLGGEQGLSRLQQGRMSGPEVIVLNTYKHIDRYNASARRMRPMRAVGMRGY